jgi:peptide/nickel transport system permease protein
MGRYIVVRLVGMIPTMLLLVLVVVLLVRIVPGNVIDVAVADQGTLTKTDRAKIERQLGLSKPVWQQYVDYLGNLGHGSLGTSLWSRTTVKSLIVARISVTLQMAVMALALALIVSVPAGIVAGVFANSVGDYALRFVAVLGLSAPSFVIATYVLLLPTIWWGWNVPLYAESARGLLPHYKSLLVPAGILAFELAASLLRITRTAVLETRRQDYIRTARAKGLREYSIITRHMLRNALIPVISVAGIQMAALFSGVVIIEQIFGIRGIGSLIISAFSTRDYTLVQGLTLVLGALVFLVNLAVDISYPLINPRVRL